MPRKLLALFFSVKVLPFFSIALFHRVSFRYPHTRARTDSRVWLEVLFHQKTLNCEHTKKDFFCVDFTNLGHDS